MHQQFEHIFSMKNIFYKYPYNYTFVDEISCWVIFEHLLHYSFLFFFFFHCKLGSTVHYVQKKEITITRYMYMLWMSIPQFHSLNFQFVWLRWCFVLFLLFSGARMLNVILRLLQVVWNVHLLFFISFYFFFFLLNGWSMLCMVLIKVYFFSKWSSGEII